MIGGPVYQLCHFGHENHIANTVDSVYYGNLRDISDHCGSVVIESRMSYKIEACINKIIAMQEVQSEEVNMIILMQNQKM